MTKTEIEQAVLKEIHTLPLDKVEATLNFLISKLLQPGSKILEFKARFEPSNSQSKLRTPAYRLLAEAAC